MHRSSGNDDANRRAIRELVSAYEALNDPEREEELAATVKLFRLVGNVEGDEFARQWLGRQVKVIQQEADG
jgi:hypothetical protein